MASFNDYCKMSSKAAAFGGPNTYQTILVLGGMMAGALTVWGVPKIAERLSPKIDKALNKGDSCSTPASLNNDAATQDEEEASYGN